MRRSSDGRTNCSSPAAWSAKSPSPAPPPPTATSIANPPRAPAKIRESLPDGSERIVHRMGDVGYFDGQGRLWFCGRKTQRVETADGPLYTEQVEPVFNTHPDVKRTALVGVGVQGGKSRCSATNFSRAFQRTVAPGSSMRCGQSRQVMRIRRASNDSFAIRLSLSTSAITRRSGGRSWRCGRQASIELADWLLPPPLRSRGGLGEGLLLILLLLTLCTATSCSQRLRTKAGSHGHICAKARKLRNSATDAEQHLWQHLRLKQLDGFKFRRQVPVAGYIADFYATS